MKSRENTAGRAPRRAWAPLLAFAVVVSLVGCSDGREGDVGKGLNPEPLTVPEPVFEASAASEGPVVPEVIAAPDAPLDESLAALGKELFTSKGCVGCHMIETAGTLSGPNLSAVSARREWPWIRAMVMQTDSMLTNDPIAQELLAQYTIRMVPPPVTEGEVRAIYEYFRTHSSPVQ
jgi:mono/diheme cytochrome c family protein